VNLAAEAPQWLALVLAILLVAAAAEDALRLRISNITVLLVIAAGLAAAIAAGIDVAVFAALLAVGTPLFAAEKARRR
jgi:Flp pilus assembly protein protease CpaA